MAPAEVDVAEQDDTRAARTRNAKRWAGAASCIGAAAAIAAHAASANFSGGANVDESAATNAGNLYLTVPGAGDTNRMTLSVDNLYPANLVVPYSPWRERAVDVANAGTVDLSTFTISTVADVNNDLSNGGAAGVVMIIDECSSTWTVGGTASEPTYTCGGTSDDALGCEVCNNGAPTDYSITPGVTSSYTWTYGGSAPTLTHIKTTHGDTNHLRFRFKLSALAPDSAQGQSMNVTFTFDGTQRAGQSA
jgi:hypothetical protein